MKRFEVNDRELEIIETGLRYYIANLRNEEYKK